MSDLKMRIKKLLAMADSTSEHEARTALLKARELMAQNKLTELDLGDVQEDKIDRYVTPYKVTKRKDFWMCDLAVVLAGRYCCSSYLTHQSGKQTYVVCLIGFQSDLEIFKEVYEYAVGYVKGRLASLSRELKSKGLDGTTALKICNGYGDGFVSGLQDSYKSQDEMKKEYGLVLTTPKEIKDLMSCMSTMASYSKNATTRYDRYKDGYEIGKDFTPNGLKGRASAVQRLTA